MTFFLKQVWILFLPPFQDHLGCLVVEHPLRQMLLVKTRTEVQDLDEVLGDD